MRRRLLIAFEIASLVAIVIAVLVTVRREHRARPIDTATSAPSSSAAIAVDQGGPDPAATAALLDGLNACLLAKGSSVKLSPTLTTILNPSDRADVDDCARRNLAQISTPSSLNESAINECLVQHGSNATIKIGRSLPADIDRQLLSSCLTAALNSSK